MEGMLVLVSAQVPEEESGGLASYFRRTAGLVDRVEGYLGASLWRDAAETDTYLLVFEYTGLKAAEEALRASAEGKLLSEEVESTKMTSHVARVKLFGRDGSSPCATDMGTFLSVSRRMSAPGYGQELADEIERIFMELSVIPGYLGSAWGGNEALQEEIVGLVVWSNREAFDASIPPGILHDVKLFRRAL